jgi:hypothetical protein
LHQANVLFAKTLLELAYLNMLLIIDKERLQAIRVIIYNYLSIIALKVLFNISTNLNPTNASKSTNIPETLKLQKDNIALATSLKIKKESYNILLKYIKTSKGLFKN